MYEATQAELSQYEELGFFVREQVFSGEELIELRAGAENVHRQILEAADRPDANPVDQVDNQKYQSVLSSTIKWEWRDDLRAVRSMEPTGHLDARLDAMIDDPRLYAPVLSIDRCDRLSVFSDKLNVKRPGGAPFPWHQEGLYWEHGAEDLQSIVSTLTYLDEGTKENGCLWVIPGSHKQGNLQGLRDRGVLGALYTDVDLIDGEAIPTEVPAGSVLYFHRDLVHGSQRNRSQTSRRVFVVAYQSSGLHRWRSNQKREVRIR
ncbi:MAG: phytanoyl-CoA dioxygenase family protein [Deltaproteobacteria bacterium]|nr:phytanoyl-CoA dioxygenase family protein [Deltaproteobacteria bacterium]MBW2696176.1 phytanoyl-CoA dioxygenase family protein [Deltaproteobacteria bacterium]